MKDTITNYIIPIIVILVISILFIYVLTPYGSATTPDSLSYLDISSNIKNGDGIVVTDFNLENFPKKSFQLENYWPPLYPILISISTLQKPSPTTVSHLSIVLLSLTILFIYLTLKNFLNWYIALTSALALCISIPIITIYSFVWSETLFIPLLIIASWSSIQYLKNDIQDDSRKYIYLLTLSISILSIAFTRYIGIIYFLLLPVTYIISKRKNRDLLWMAVASGVYGLCVGSFLFNNYSKTGFISGAYRPPSNKTVFDNINDLLAAAYTLVPDSIMALIIIFIISLLISLLYIKFVIKNNEKIPPDNFKSIIILTFIFLLYVTALVTLRTVRFFDDLDVRLLVPIFPVLWALLFILLSTLSNKNRLNIIICTPVIFLIIAFPVAGYKQFLTTMDNWGKTGNPELTGKGELAYMNYTFNHQLNEIPKILTPLVGSESVLITNRPMAFKFITGIPSVQLPHKIDLEKIRAINRLPEKSIILLVNQKQIDQFSALSDEHSLDFKTFDLDGALAIETPIKIPGSK